MNYIGLIGTTFLIGIGISYTINHYITKNKKFLLKLYINGYFIEIVNKSSYYINEKQLLNFKPFCKYITDLFNPSGLAGNKSNTLKNIEIIDPMVVNDKILFLYLKVNIFDNINNSFIPGIVFLRPNSVAILVTDIDRNGDEHILLVRQARVAGARITEEIPAGMIESKDQDPTGRAISELEEETGIKIINTSLNYLGDFEPSIGGCNEKIDLYHCPYPGMIDKIINSANQVFGNKDEGEYIKRLSRKIKDVLIDENFIDGKSKIALLLYLQKKLNNQ